MMNITGDPSGPPQRAKTFTGDFITALTGWASTMMACGGQQDRPRPVVDLAQYEAVAQTNGNALPLFTGEGAVYGHTGNRAPGFQPYDTFQCADGWVFIGAVGGAIFDRVPVFLGLDPAEYSYAACSQDAAAVNSEKGKELDRRLREYCATRTSLEVETALNAAKIGCARVYSTRDQYLDEHYEAHLKPLLAYLKKQNRVVPIRLGVVPKMSLTPGRIWRGAPSIGDEYDRYSCQHARPVGTGDR
jgi:crotonobetainyl-CoA:carnitine CoA-transferase CaiB-like acyl-CoA transferase